MEFIASANYRSWMTRGIPQKGDVLFTTEAPLANVAQLDTDEKVAFAQRIIIMQPEKTKLDSTFLKYLLLSGPVQQRIRIKGTGATVQGIKARLLKLIEISFPKTLSEQEEIVEKLDDLLRTLNLPLGSKLVVAGVGGEQCSHLLPVAAVESVHLFAGELDDLVRGQRFGCQCGHS